MEFGAQKEGRDGPFAVQEEERRSLRANSEGGTAIGPFGCFFALDWNETCLYRPDRKAVLDRRRRGEVKLSCWSASDLTHNRSDFWEN
jgi:hypothetical protein